MVDESQTVDPRLTVERKFRIALVAGGILLALAFAVGLALGLNIHPPDKYAYERGHEKGEKDGQVAGYAKGKLEGMKAGAAAESAMWQGRVAQLTREKEGMDGNYQVRLAKWKSDELAKFKAEAQQERLVAIDAVRADCDKKGKEELRQQAEQLEAKHQDELATGKKDAEARGYQRGLDDGGYTRGFDAGKKEGLVLGASKGKEKAWGEARDAEKQGRDDGYKKGLTDGEKKGYDRGYKHGESVGYEKGKKYGYQLGYDEGYRKGFADGVEHGRAG